MSAAGKSLIAPIISSFERSELWRINYLNDYIPTICALGAMDRDAASALLNIMADVDIYNLMIARDTNFRSADDSGVQKNMLFERYHERLSGKEGAEVKSDILRKKPILTMMVHYLFGNSEILFTSFGKKLKLYIVMVRHPLWLVENWYRGAWHERIGRDEREFKLCCEVGGHVVPWFAAKYAEEYVRLAPLDKTVRVISSLLDGFYAQHENLNEQNKAKVMFIPFERMAADPWSFINRMTAALGTQTTPNTGEMMGKMRLPRSFDMGELGAKKTEFDLLAKREGLTESSRMLMRGICAEYERRYLS
ncbi:MAG TPA: hypothetical protein DCZ01_05080 [Elusimicrobia bacterium]|nr:MAG: hypothetical protein A2X40_00670 [Elusimicrobia bacterium GWC2_65_9]OHC66038.1 MAG: hypothetical protein A2040_03580 [Rhodocyclales bacterium GWA2_65_19]HAZ07897.1 hypothetical protein [Elusimicrobiota bacterium]